MSKSPKNINKKKMEEIALKLLNSNQKWKNANITLNIKNKLNTNNYNDNIINGNTEKEILTSINYQKIINNKKNEKSKNKIEYKIKYIDYYSINNIKEEEEKERKKSEISKTKKIINNKDIEIIPKIKGLEKISSNCIDKLNKSSRDESLSNTFETNSKTIEYSTESSNNSINFEILNQTNLIYEELKKQFYNILNENEKNKKDIYFKCKVLAFDYIQFLFGEDIQKIIKLFNYCLDIGKFIIYQIYLFLSIIYLDDYKKLDNSIEMSYKTILFYSSQNFNEILNLIENPIYCSEPKKLIGIKTKNKIIISILKLIYPNLPTNSQIKEFINPENNKNQINDRSYKIGKFPLKCLEEIGKNKNNNLINYEINKKLENPIEERYNSLGIINLLLLLKNNKELNEKLNQIEEKVLNILEQSNYKVYKNNTFNNNIPEYIKNKNNNDSNNQLNNPNFTTSSLSSLNINKSKSNNNNNSNKNHFSNINKLLLPHLNIKINYKFYLIFELDETLVHYQEEENNYYVKVRYGVEDCFNKINDFCEITIVSTSSKEYTDIVVDNINKKNCYIQNRIYKELFEEDENFDLSSINRDMNKCIFICHEEEFFNAPKKNILQLTEFNGEESDREMIFLCKELMRIKNDDIKDVSEIISEMSNNIKV